MNDDGSIDLDATIALLPPELEEKGSKVINTCGNKSIIFF